MDADRRRPGRRTVGAVVLTVIAASTAAAAAVALTDPPGRARSRPPAVEATAGSTPSTFPGTPGTPSDPEPAGTRLAGASVGLDGSTVAAWEPDDLGVGPATLVVRDAAGTVATTRIGAGVQRVTPVDGGWLLLTYDGGSQRYRLLGTDATVTPVRAERAAVRAEPGDLAVFLPTHGAGLFRPSTGTTHPIDVSGLVGSRLVGAYVTPGGVLVGSTESASGVVAAVRFDGDWDTHTLTRGPGVHAGPVTGVGDRVATYVVRDPAPRLDGGPEPVELVAVSDDAGSGAGWRTTTAPRVDALAAGIVVTASGTVVVTLDRGALVLREGRDVALDAGLGGDLTAVGDELYRRTSDGLEVSTDEGRSWRDVDLPR